MSTVSPDAVLGQLKWRYATKKFDPARPIDPALWDAIEEAVTLSPSSYGLQPWRFVVVTDPAVRQQLRAAAWNQPQITDASHLVVFASRKGLTVADADRHVARVAAVRGVPVESLAGFRDLMAGSIARQAPEAADQWAARQAYIALGVFLSTCALLGVDSCPMEGFQPDRFDEVLGLRAKGYGSVVLGAAGYRAADDPAAAQAKVRYPRSEVVERV